MTTPDRKPHTMKHNPYPTSPWTEAYHDAPSHLQEGPAYLPAFTAQPAQSSYNTDDQRPTHDALSLIYNQGY